MPRLDRLTAILIHLQTKRVVKAQELADRFNVSLRTIYRDVRSLEEAGVPIGAEAGVGYFLEDYHLPPVMFSQNEASALLFGAKLVDQYTDGSVREAFESALYKIKSVLKRGEKDHIDDLSGQIAVQRAAIRLPGDGGMLSTIQAAIVTRHRLRMVYQRPYAKADTEREIEPIGLLHYGVGWHLIAWCHLRQAYRDFRTDRIVRLTDTGQPFPARDRLSLSQYLGTLQFTAQLTEVLVCFDEAMALHAQVQRYHHGYVDEEMLDGQVRMRFLTMSTEGLCRWLLMFGNGIRLESPLELRAKLQAYAQEAAAHWS
ncbi:helix-turn-helix transcriptional regulator [Fibrella sp. WM1]|uniref:helix-turn-helix transcriptional regulator n=1 Tax=Fibrella musci TaxID=3242485 RepID=UPI0035202790